MIKMILYHGTDCLFEKIDLTKSIGKRDFGVGFYTTTVSAQAESWAKSKMLRNGSEAAYIYVFEANITDDISIKRYSEMSIEWLEMIKENRTYGGVRHNYDIVTGAVANDDTMVTVNRFVQGIYTAEEAIERLRFSRVNDQISFHTPKAVGCLKVLRRYRVD